MMRLAPALTPRLKTSMVAMAVVTTPLTTPAGSPALNVSTVSDFHSTPTLFLMRSMISCAVTAAARRDPLRRPNGTVPAPIAVTTKSRLDSLVMWFQNLALSANCNCRVGVNGMVTEQGAHYRPADDIARTVKEPP